MAGLIDNLIDCMIQNNIAQERAVDLFMDYMPDEQTLDFIINFNEYAGTGNAQYTDLSVRSIQVQVRGLDVSLAKDKCWEVYKAICPNNLLLEINDNKIISKARSSPIKLSTDSKGRTTYFFNVALTTNND